MTRSTEIKAAPQLVAKTMVRSELTKADRDAMHELLDTHFEGVTAEQFQRDLDEKDWVLNFFSGERLIGFSTLAASAISIGEKPLNVIYSGDTIMAPEAWGSRVLAKSWIALVDQVQASLPPGPCYWLLLSSGFRTYRFLPVFWKTFWPRFDSPAPVETQALLNQIARQRFGDNYDAASGLVRFDCPQRLRPRLAIVPSVRSQADPHIAFFLRQNPNWASGDELVCLTTLDDVNLTPAGRRIKREACP